MTSTNELNGLFQFDDNEIIVGFNARPGAEKPQIVQHKLRKPTLQELIERESQIKYELVELSTREDEIHADDDFANGRLWDKIAIAVMGYRDADDWLELGEADRALMRIGHKTKAILAMYAGNCEVECEDEMSVSIGADVWTVKQNIGVKRDAPDYVIRHILREPTEAERAKFKSSSSRTSHIKGAKKAQVRVKTNLKAFIELYDALIVNIQGGTVHGQEFGAEGQIQYKASFLAVVDPIWKRQVIQCHMDNLEAQLSD